MNVKIEEGWKQILKDQFEAEYFDQLTSFVRDQYKSKAVYPPPKQIFRAFDLCPLDEVKVVILGQDPYHGRGQANGLCFAVNEGVRLPPSLQNIYKEIEDDLGVKMDFTKGDLSSWAKQGVLLLNATLTVEAAKAGSHQGKGWELFTDAVIETLSEKREDLVFILWGRYARNKNFLIDSDKHLILEAAHPSPFSAHSGFFGCKHFSKTNDFLTSKNLEPIKWQDL